MTVRDASTLLQKANRAADDLAMAGIVNSISSSGKIVAGTSTVEVGLTKANCEKLKDQLPFLVDLETYKAAQAIMTGAGHLTAERATQNLRTQIDLLQVAKSQAPQLSKACTDLGVTEFLGLHHK